MQNLKLEFFFICSQKLAFKVFKIINIKRPNKIPTCIKVLII